MSEATAASYRLGQDREIFAAEASGTILGTYYMRPDQDGGDARIADYGFMTVAEAKSSGVAQGRVLTW